MMSHKLLQIYKEFLYRSEDPQKYRFLWIIEFRDLLRDMQFTTEEMFELVTHWYSDNRNRLKDIASELRHCNIDQPGSLNYSDWNTIPSSSHYNHCQQMPTVNENKGYMQPLCHSLTLVFKNISHDRENIQTSIHNFADTFAFTSMFDNKAMCHAAYRQYVMWQHGHLGSGRRIVIPLWRVWAALNLYQSPNGVYTGFIPSRRITKV